MRSFALLACLVGAALAVPQVKQAGTTYTFKMRLTKGQVLRYTQSTTVVSQGTNLKMTGPFVITVANVRTNIFDLAVATGPMKSGATVMSPLQSAQISVDPSGRTVKGSERAFGASAALPVKPIKVGDKWSEVTDLPIPGGKPSSVTTTYQFKGLKTVGKRTLALLDATLKGEGEMSLNGKGTVQLDAADGTLFRYEVVSDITLQGGGKAVKAKSTTVVARA